jgi:threonine/homoserine/homoserine lactone efflux protein
LSSAPVRGAYMRARRWIEAGLGCFFLFASVKLATSRL